MTRRPLGPMRTTTVVSLLLGLPVLGACAPSGGADPDAMDGPLPPIVFAPGLGMSALSVSVDRPGERAAFDFLLPSMNPVDTLPGSAASALDYSVARGLAPQDAAAVPRWLSLAIAPDGTAASQVGVKVEPVSVGRDFGAECPRYLPLAQDLATQGWQIDENLLCLPFDYRLAPGANDFVDDLRDVVEHAVADAGGRPAVLACHSQGCLMAYHALRTLDEDWIRGHIGLLYGFAGQFSGCSDCLRWAFQPGWSWQPETPGESPVDPTWVGEMALGLQSSVYGDAVLYRNGTREYRADEAGELLNDAGAVAMAQAMKTYGLDAQEWFRVGAVERVPLPVPVRVVFGDGLTTTVGYDFDGIPPRSGTCSEPQCAGFWSTVDPAPIEADGDAGDSTWMNAAPEVWTLDPVCDIRRLPGVDHMAIVTDATAVALLTASARAMESEPMPCLDSLP